MIPSSIIKQVSKELNISEDATSQVYNSFWEFIKCTIRDKIQLDTIHTEEQFLNTRTSFNIPSLGKLGVTFGRWKSLKSKQVK